MAKNLIWFPSETWQIMWLSPSNFLLISSLTCCLVALLTCIVLVVAVAPLFDSRFRVHIETRWRMDWMPLFYRRLCVASAYAWMTTFPWSFRKQLPTTAGYRFRGDLTQWQYALCVIHPLSYFYFFVAIIMYAIGASLRREVLS